MATSTAWLDRYLEVLVSRLGLDAAAVEDGEMIRVTCRGLVVMVNNTGLNDPSYLHAWSLFANDEVKQLDPDAVARFCAERTADLKMLKVLSVDAGIALSVEAPVSGPGLLPSLDHLCTVLPRAFDALLGGAVEICELVERQRIEEQLAGIEAATTSALDPAAGEDQ